MTQDSLKNDEQQVQVQVNTPFGHRIESYELHGNRVNPYIESSWNWSTFIALPTKPTGLLTDNVLWIGAFATVTNVVRICWGVFSPAQVLMGLVFVCLPLLWIIGTLIRVDDGRVQMHMMIRLAQIVLGIIISITVL